MKATDIIELDDGNKFLLVLTLVLLVSGCDKNSTNSSNKSLLSNENSSAATSTNTSLDIEKEKQELREKYPLYTEYTNRDQRNIAYNRFRREIIVWKISESEYGCGFYMGSDKSTDHDYIIFMQTEYSCPLSTFARILELFYDTTDPNFILQEYYYPYSERRHYCGFVKEYWIYKALNLKASYIRFHIAEGYLD